MVVDVAKEFALPPTFGAVPSLEIKDILDCLWQLLRERGPSQGRVGAHARKGCATPGTLC